MPPNTTPPSEQDSGDGGSCSRSQVTQRIRELLLDLTRAAVPQSATPLPSPPEPFDQAPSAFWRAPPAPDLVQAHIEEVARNPTYLPGSLHLAGEPDPAAEQPPQTPVVQDVYREVWTRWLGTYHSLVPDATLARYTNFESATRALDSAPSDEEIAFFDEEQPRPNRLDPTSAAFVPRSMAATATASEPSNSNGEGSCTAVPRYVHPNAREEPAPGLNPGLHAIAAVFPNGGGSSEAGPSGYYGQGPPSSQNAPGHGNNGSVAGPGEPWTGSGGDADLIARRGFAPRIPPGLYWTIRPWFRHRTPSDFRRVQGTPPGFQFILPPEVPRETPTFPQRRYW